MAAGKPIVAARAAAVPEVLQHGILVEPENAEALAEGIAHIYRDPDLRHPLGSAGSRDVEQYDVDRIARAFLSEVARIVPTIIASE